MPGAPDAKVRVVTEGRDLIFYTHHRGYDPALQRSRTGTPEVDERLAAWTAMDLPAAERDRRWRLVWDRQVADLRNWHPEPEAAETATTPGPLDRQALTAMAAQDLPSDEGLDSLLALRAEAHPLERAAEAFAAWVRLVPWDFRGGWLVATRLIVAAGYPPPVPDPAEAARLPDLAETAARGETAPVLRALSLSLCRALEALLLG